MEYNELMQSFAAKYGLADLKIDNGTAVLEIDGMTVGFIHDPATDSVMVVAEIGYPETDVSANFASAMLKANYLFAGTAGAVLCQNPETGAYALMREYRLVEHDPKTFEERLKDLVDDMKEWTEFKFGDPRFKEIGQKLAQRQNAYIQEVINQPNKFFSCWSTKLDYSKVGTATIAQRTTLDLTKKPLPVVTDVTFSQTFSPDEIRLTSDQ